MAGRFKDIDWDLAGSDGKIGTWEKVSIAVLMDIRDELKLIRSNLAQIQFYTSTLKCSEALTIPRILRRISANTHKPKRRRKAAVKS